MKHFFLITALIITLAGCNTTRPASEAVAPVANLNCDSCKPLQEKYFPELVNIANNSPHVMKVGSLGFLEFKSKTYISIDLVGATYNTIQTTTSTRLTNEFMGRYKSAAQMILSDMYKNEIDGVRISLTALSHNFVSDTYGLNKVAENLELFTNKTLLSEFLQGDITAQNLIDRSLVFINGQRMDFTLSML